LAVTSRAPSASSSSSPTTNTTTALRTTSPTLPYPVPS
jgi:hypothetical protein